MDESMGQPTRQSMRTAIRSDLESLATRVNALESLACELSDSMVGPKPCDSDKKSPESPCDFVGQIKHRLSIIRESVNRSTRILEELNEEFRNVKSLVVVNL